MRGRVLGGRGRGRRGREGRGGEGFLDLIVRVSGCLAFCEDGVMV